MQKYHVPAAMLVAAYAVAAAHWVASLMLHNGLTAQAAFKHPDSNNRCSVIPTSSSCRRVTKAVKAGRKGKRWCPFTLSPPGSPMGPFPSNLLMEATYMQQAQHMSNQACSHSGLWHK
jgi:hypothetical protein